MKRSEFKQKKTRKCVICRSDFEPRSMTHKTCQLDCALILVERNNSKKASASMKIERKHDKERKEANKSRNDWAKEAEVIVNKYVRLRDAHLSCISCDKDRYWDGQWHASHYKSVGSNSALRYNLFNIHKSCSQCNYRKGGNISEYRPRLIDKIGIDRIEWLENHPRSRDYSIEYLKRLKTVFLKKIKRLGRKY